MTTGENRPVPRWVPLVVVVLFLAWILGTPLLAWTGMITAAPFFGENPTADEVAAAKAFLAGAGVCGFVAPLLGIVVGARNRLPGVVWLFGIALALTTAVVVWVAVQ